MYREKGRMKRNKERITLRHRQRRILATSFLLSIFHLIKKKKKRTLDKYASTSYFNKSAAMRRDILFIRVFKSNDSPARAAIYVETAYSRNRVYARLRSLHYGYYSRYAAYWIVISRFYPLSLSFSLHLLPSP